MLKTKSQKKEKSSNIKPSQRKKTFGSFNPQSSDKIFIPFFWSGSTIIEIQIDWRVHAPVID